MKQIYYFAAWTDSDCLLGCDHQHQTVTSATACINVAGGYVMAVETSLRELTGREEAEFQLAKYGIGGDPPPDAGRIRPLGWLPAKRYS
jgi:hypothetical protein